MKFSWKKKLNDLDAKEEQRWRKRKGPMAKRYFDDFEVRTVLGKNGKTKRELIYIGDTYTAQVSDQVYQRRKWVFLALATLCAAVFVGANSVNVASNRQGMLAALGILIVIPLFLVCYACVCRLRKPRTLQRMQYIETSMFLKFGAFFSGLLGLGLFVWHSVFALVGAQPGELAGEAFVAAAWGVLAGSCIYLWIAELRTEYRQCNREGNVIRKEHFKRNG